MFQSAEAKFNAADTEASRRAACRKMIAATNGLIKAIEKQMMRRPQATRPSD
jgi:hypothetical protein